MADISPTGSTEAFYFSDRIRRKVVVKHKRTKLFSAERFHALFILAGTQRQHPEHLSFPTGKKGTAMWTRQDTDLTGNRPDFVESAIVDPASFFEDEVTADFFLQII